MSFETHSLTVVAQNQCFRAARVGGLPILACFSYAPRKAIAAHRDSLDIRLPILDVPQRLAQQRDVVGEVTFLDEGTGPDRAEQIVF